MAVPEPAPAPLGTPLLLGRIDEVPEPVPSFKRECVSCGVGLWCSLSMAEVAVYFDLKPLCEKCHVAS